MIIDAVIMHAKLDTMMGSWAASTRTSKGAPAVATMEASRQRERGGRGRRWQLWWGLVYLGREVSLVFEGLEDGF